MKVSLKWLTKYTDINLAPRELAEKLTMAGLEVKELKVVGGSWTNISIGEVVALDAHPNADRLKLVTIDLKQRQITVVTGASNLKVGDKVPFAAVGAQLIDGHTGEVVKLKATKIRGINSEGMVCSEKELGISDDHEGIMVLSSEAPIGASLGDYLGDIILDLDITPNRPDCLSIIGVAREIAVLTAQTLHVPEIDYKESETSVETLASIKITEPVLCPRYCASVINGVRIKPSPYWLQQQLMTYGVRPINNIVDVTNYVMLEFGQPLHAFDYHKLSGKQIIVRRAKNKELLVTLDNINRTLTPEMLVIADAEKAVAIAGIMGGKDTEVNESTSAVLIESANFDRATLRSSSANLGLRSEASLRFEKGLSRELPLIALKRATQLILEVAGGEAAKGIVDIYPGQLKRQPIRLTNTQVKRLLGMEISTDEIIKTLTLLGFGYNGTETVDEIQVEIPYWRTDITCSTDLVEEVARIIGYDRIPATMLSAPIPTREVTPGLTVREKLRNVMVSCGFQEVLTYSLTSIDLLNKIFPDKELSLPQPLKVANPMSREQEYLRTSLRANLLATLAINQRHETGGIKLFEIGKVFIPQKDDLPEERCKLCAVLSGERSEVSWRQHSGLVDFFDAKGVVECLLSWIGTEIKFIISKDDSLHPGKGTTILIGEIQIGVIGELHPKVVEDFEILGSVYLIEIDITELSAFADSFKKYVPLPRFPSVVRDIALVASEEVTYEQVKNIIKSFPLVSEVTLFDLYRGEQVPQGKKSFCFRVKYQSPTQTLTEEQVTQVQRQILNTLYSNLGLVLRI